MSEGTEFWGVAVPRLTPQLTPGTGLLQWRGKLADGKPIHYYPLFYVTLDDEGFVTWAELLSEGE